MIIPILLATVAILASLKALNILHVPWIVILGIYLFACGLMIGPLIRRK